MAPVMSHAMLIVLAFAVVCFAQSKKYVAWHIQQGNGCSNTKTIATYYYPTNVCFGNSTNSYQYLCDLSRGPVNETYSAFICGGTAISSLDMPENCVNNGTLGYYYECVDLQDDLAADERRIYQYTDTNCQGKILYTIAVQNNACFGAFGTSVKVTCDNDQYTRTDYAGSIDCTGGSNVTIANDETCTNGQAVRCSSSFTLVVSTILLVSAAIALLL